MLRFVPTDAQKIEALKLASGASAFGLAFHHASTSQDYAPDGCAVHAWKMARMALRLLGLPTE